MKAIETRYKGYRFRSRLEARWAVFFDALGVSWQYEPEGFVLRDGTHYLPDFYLPVSDLWVEVKGGEPTQEERRKAEMLHEMERPVVIAIGEPFYGRILVYAFDSTDGSAGEQWWGEHQEVFWLPTPYGGDRIDTGLFVAVVNDFSSRHFHAFGVERVSSDRARVAKESLGWIIETAAMKARAARFEHGETPR
jgi:hypothetical protein